MDKEIAIECPLTTEWIYQQPTQKTKQTKDLILLGTFQYTTYTIEQTHTLFILM